MKQDFFIIGGGVAGLSVAYELLLRGHGVTLADYTHPGQSSWAGAGILSTLRPWNFDEAVSRLALAGMQAWPGWAADIAERSGLDPEFWACGMEYRAVEPIDFALDWCKQHHLPATSKAPGELWLPSVGQVRNPRLIAALFAAISALGGKILPDCNIGGGKQKGRKLVSVVSSQSEYSADTFIWAGGAWTGLALGQISPAPNIRPVRGQMLLYAPGSHALDHVLYQDGLYLVPRRDGHLLAGSTKENVGFDADTTPETLQRLHEAACNLVAELRNHQPIHSWAGLRPGSPDNIPVIDRHPDYDNVWLHTGHYRYGVTMSPSSSRLLVELLAGEEPHLDPTPYSWQSAMGRSWQDGSC